MQTIIRFFKTIFLVDLVKGMWVTLRYTPQPAFTWEQLNAEYVFGLRWWTIDEIAASDASFAPRDLARLLRSLLVDGPPDSPVDVPV